MTPRLWTQIEIELLSRHYPDSATKDIARALGRTEASIRQMAHRLGLKKTDEFLSSSLDSRFPDGSPGHHTRFKKGMAPWNKGLKGYQPDNHDYRFKPGNTPHTYRPIGSYRVTRDGVLLQKINDEKGHTSVRWRGVHELVWTAQNGPVPPGHIVVFKPGMRTINPDEITIDRVECISRAENMRRNSLHRYPKEITDAIRARAVLNRRINHVEKHQ